MKRIMRLVLLGMWRADSAKIPNSKQLIRSETHAENVHIASLAGADKNSECTCYNGTPRPSSWCADSANKIVCSACNTGYFLDGDSSCQACHGVCATCNQQSMSCTSCRDGSYLSDNSCKKCDAPCKTCKSAGLWCLSCMDGHYLGIDTKCQECHQECDKCTGGSANQCISCNSGMFLQGTMCKANQCKCADGTGSTGTGCATNGASHCSECNSGYGLVSDRCEANQCNCRNGIGSTGPKCENIGDSHCSACNSGYTLDSDQCKANECNCVGGAGSTGTECEANGANHCSKCNSGYNLVSHKCEVNQCTCENGLPASDTECSKHGTEECTECKKRFYLESGKCKKCHTQCDECSGGSAAQCKSCKSDMFLHESVCKADKCICPGGTTVTGKKCTKLGAPTMGVHHCKKCNNGYYLDKSTDQCEVRQCECDNGIPATYTSCSKNGRHECKVCHKWHYLKSKKCKAYECTCDGGIPACSGDKDKIEACSSCQEGYYLRPNEDGHPTCESCAIKHEFSCTKCTAVKCEARLGVDE